jgi:hypothetical protein
MVVDMVGPTSLRRNDLFLLRKSRINDRMANMCQLYSTCNYSIFGDSAYHLESNISSYVAHEELFNQSMKSVRIQIEWSYGSIASLFPYVANKMKLKILKTFMTHIVYTVAVILKNIYTCFYGNQSMLYFNIELPRNMLVKYIKQEDF